jgi:hypothetical protein
VSIKGIGEREMRVKVQKQKLIKIIRREFSYYTEEQIVDIIDKYGAAYFNDRGSDLNIRYIGFGYWEVTI